MNKFQSVPALNLSNKGKTHWAYWRWCFNTFIVAGFIGFGSCIDVIANKDEAGSSLVVISCGFASLSFLFWASAAVLIWNKDEIVIGNIYLKNILKDLGQLRFNRNPRTRTGKIWRMTSYVIKLAVFSLSIIPFTLTPLLFFVGLDPFRYTFPKIISPSLVCDSSSSSTCHSIAHGIMFACRIECSTICNFEACRFFAVLFCMLMYILELIVRCMEVISCAHLTPGCVNDTLSFSNSYTALRVAHKVLYPVLCKLFALILGGGFVIILISNIATIRAYNILPIEVYWLMPVASIIFAFFMAFSLPYAVKVYKSSEEMVHLRKLLSSHWKMVAVAKRKLDKIDTAAIRPIQISCGRFFDLEVGAESTYFDIIFQRTVDGLLIPM